MSVSSHHSVPSAHLPLQSKARRTAWREMVTVVVSRLLLLCGVIVLWQLASGSLVNPLFISSPLAVATQLVAWTLDGTLWPHTAITLQEALLGLFYGLISGVCAGLLLGTLPVVAKVLDPFIVALYSIPKVALAPLFIVWFGIEVPMKVILAAVTVFFLVFVNTLAGVRSVDHDLLDAVRLMGGTRSHLLFKVIVPSTLGSILTGVHLAIPYALIGAVMAELIASNRGIGYLIAASASQFELAGVFAALLVLTVIAGLLNALVNLLDQKTSRWKTAVRPERKPFL
jgi:NitT/TauT family transport system permease protein